MNENEKRAREEALERYHSGQVDADIEGLSRDPVIEAMVARWRDEGVDIPSRIERIKAYFIAQDAQATE